MGDVADGFTVVTPRATRTTHDEPSLFERVDTGVTLDITMSITDERALVAAPAPVQTFAVPDGFGFGFVVNDMRSLTAHSDSQPLVLDPSAIQAIAGRPFLRLPRVPRHGRALNRPERRPRERRARRASASTRRTRSTSRAGPSDSDEPEPPLGGSQQDLLEQRAAA
jgi:hypothetical protein